MVPATTDGRRARPDHLPSRPVRDAGLGGGSGIGQHPAPADGSTYWSRPLPPDRFARFAQDMHRAIVAQAGSPDADDALLETVIAEAVETFLSRAGHPVAAALMMSALMRRVGAREAAIGRTFDVLENSMRIARSAAEAYLPRLMAAHPLTEHRAHDLRNDLDIFLDQLREHARAGFDRQWSMEEISPDHADLALRRVMFDDKTGLDLRRVQLLALHAGRVLPPRVQPVVSLDAPLPRSARIEMLPGFSPHEAYLPDDAHVEELGVLGLVIGPAVPIEQAPRSLGLARRAAALVAAGLLPRPEPLLRCDDVLGRIATLSDPYLLDLLTAKHLTAFLAMSPTRRVDMGELLLEWLETGDPVNEIARRQQRHLQTVHARMRSLRLALGATLSDGDQRVELILVLRRELPRWRAEAAR